MGDSAVNRLFQIILLSLLSLVAACQAVNSATPPSVEQTAAPSTAQPIRTLPATFTAAAATPIESKVAVNDIECQEAVDCVLVIHVDSCCSCPEIMSRASAVGNEAVVLYEQGQNYGEFLPESCGNVDCEPCAPPPIPYCTEDGYCRELRSVEAVLLECPGCYDQAAIVAYENGDTPAAITYCLQTDTSACIHALFEAAYASGDLEGELAVCLHPSYPDPAGCLTILAPALAAFDFEQAVALCQQIPAGDARHFGCVLDVAGAIYASDPGRSREICELLQGDRVGQCLGELE